ncbi:hypothetical protein BO71DRAFT_439963 [Aspergillus ellipticus CBS 707.79]|uniref:HNH nuclease domain-containing protein n=1 Tax=Aspergillus ellipticus CBS 707.79 TaxID=1448320 RepID=A0A319DF22_9EURO|nr:hypothetical protein BO71DRAFT_439963 [Aspergillus ellipticus CBS 707.79]
MQAARRDAQLCLPLHHHWDNISSLQPSKYLPSPIDCYLIPRTVNDGIIFPNWPADKINSLNTSLVQFARYLVNNFFLTLVAAKIPQPSSALSHSQTPAANDTPQRIANSRQTWLVRDHHRCVVSRRFDCDEGERRYQRDRDNVKDDDGKPLLPECDNVVLLEVAHRIPHSLMPSTSSGKYRHQANNTKNPHDVSPRNIDRPLNALTLIHDHHILFANFEIAFEPVDDTEPHTYTVDFWDHNGLIRFSLPATVRFDLTPDRSVDPPSSQLMRIHSTIGRILHRSGVGDYIE